MRTPNLRSALPVSLLALSLALTGCGGGEEKEKKPAAGQSSAAPEPEVPATWPLTGQEVQGDTEVEQDHPVVIAKIDNSKSSSPQVGLSKADMVVEELVEGGTTRLAAFFYSRLPKDVGPVRSMRASDIGIVSPVDGVIAASGAAGPTIGRLNEAGVKFFTEGGPGYYRKAGRYAPYNLFTSLAKVGKATEDGKTSRPDDYLPWGAPEDLPQGEVATTIAADFGSHTTNWQFKNGTYVNTNSFAAEGDRFKPDTVLVLRVEVVDAGYRDPAGNFVPESRFRGGGKAQLFHNGTLVEGEWSKKKLGSALKLSTAQGPLTVPAGKVWIELVPVDSAGGSVTYGK